MTVNDEHVNGTVESDRETLRFLYNTRLTLFNVRREHEWRVFFGAVTLIGAVDAAIITKGVCLPPGYSLAWKVMLLIVTAACLIYEYEIQRRNRIDRIAMFQMHHLLCNSIKSYDLSAYKCIGLPVDYETDKATVDVATYSERPTYRPHFLWAFVWQALVLVVLCVVSFGITSINCPPSQSASPPRISTRQN